MSWKHVSLSVTGKSHIERNEPGQDYCRAGDVRLGDRDFFIGLAADGAGSTSCGGEGAEITCESLFDSIVSAIRDHGDVVSFTDEDIVAWITTARDAISARAGEKSQRVKEYACTVLGIVAARDKTILFQIGDGCMVTGDGTGYLPVFWPEQGEYANTTYFLTDDDFRDHIKTEHREQTPVEIAMFTDGLQNLVLQYASRSVHAGFFRPLFAALRNETECSPAALSSYLKTLLTREDVNARSDDDKTLILATETRCQKE